MRPSLLLSLASSLELALGQFCEHQWDGDFAENNVDGVSYLRSANTAAAPELEIQPLIVNGPSNNRVDLIFLGDGCKTKSTPRPCIQPRADTDLP